MTIWRMSTPGRGTRECKGPEAGESLAFEKQREETSVAVAEGGRERVVRVRTEREWGARLYGALSTLARVFGSL